VIDRDESPLSYDEFGRMVMHIRHELLKGISPEMVAWWFANIAGDIEVEGMRFNKYLVWHPQDHILFELAQPAQTGARAQERSSASLRHSGGTRISTSISPTR
jgi:hypothetical protein